MKRGLLGLLVLGLQFSLVAEAVGGYVAIAYNPTTGKAREIHSATSLNSAETAALAACGSGCQIVGSMLNGDVVLAVSSQGNGNSVYAVGTGLNYQAAENVALQNCQELPDAGTCTVKSFGHSQQQ